MKKKILSIVLAVVLVATAIFFAVYQAYGHTYNYAKKDMSKFVNLSLADILGADDKSILYDDFVADEKEALAYIADLFSDYSTLKLGTKYEGEIGQFDTVAYVYYITMENADGTITTISAPATIDPTVASSKLPKVQMNAEGDLEELMAALLGQKVEKYSFNIITAVTGEDAQNPIFADDNIYFDYEKTDKDGKVTTGSYESGKAADLDAEFGAGFGAEMLKLEIGDKNAEIKIGEDTYKVTIRFVTRNTVESGAIQTGDVVYFRYKSGSDTLTYFATAGADNASLNEKFKCKDFAEKLFALEIGSSEVEIEAEPAEGEELKKKFVVSVEYAYRADLSNTDEEDIARAETYFEFDRTYAEDAEDVAEIKDAEGNPIELKGKTVRYHVVPLYFYDATYDYENIVTVLKYPSATDVKDTLPAKFLSAFVTYEGAVEALEAAKTALETAEKALAESTADDKTSLENAVTKAKGTVTSAEKALDEAVTALDKLEYKKAEDEESVPALESYLLAYAKRLVAEHKYNKAVAAWEAAKGAEGVDVPGSEAEKALADAAAAKEKAETEYNMALASEVAAQHHYANEKGIFVDEATIANIALELYDAFALERAQEINDNEFREDIAKLVWDGIVELVKERGVSYPKKALRVTYEALYDAAEEDYYENKTKTYSKYKNFKAYLAGEVGADYKAEFEKQAEEIVLYNLIIYRIVELTEVELTDEDTQMFAFYVMYLGYDEAGMETSTLFDKAMDHITEELYPEIFAEEDAE